MRNAAIDLNVDHAVVGRHLRALEALLGTTLIERGNEGDHWLTPDGQMYHARISASLAEISDATDRLRRRNDLHLLVCCSPGFAYYWLMPRLPDFGTRFPQIELALRPVDRVASCSPKVLP